MSNTLQVLSSSKCFGFVLILYYELSPNFGYFSYLLVRDNSIRKLIGSIKNVTCFVKIKKDENASTWTNKYLGDVITNQSKDWSSPNLATSQNDKKKLSIFLCYQTNSVRKYNPGLYVIYHSIINKRLTKSRYFTGWIFRLLFKEEFLLIQQVGLILHLLKKKMKIEKNI